MRCGEGMEGCPAYAAISTKLFKLMTLGVASDIDTQPMRAYPEGHLIDNNEGAAAA